MSDDDVVDLSSERIRRDYKKGEEAHANGEAFEFSPYDFDDDGIGIIEGTRPVIVMTDPAGLAGICMTTEDARKLGAALIEAAESPYLP